MTKTWKGEGRWWGVEEVIAGNNKGRCWAMEEVIVGNYNGRC